MVMDSANKRIAVNTVILYAKLIINIVVSFVVARLVLKALGAEDYGLYNVIGGIVVMLNTFGTSMIATSYRYIAVEIGKKEDGNPNKIYNTILIIHLVLAIALILIGETLGVFYVNNYLNVNPAKIGDSLFILHLSLLTTAFAVITVPVNGLLIAKENFLFLSVTESINAILKLGLILILMHISGDRLRYYAVFLAICQALLPLCFQVYARCKYASIVKWKFNRIFEDYKGVLAFAWWMLIGAVAVMGQVQGAAIIINYFFGTILNAAFGLASQVKTAVMQFTNTLRQAAVPQIMKSQNTDESRSMTLVYAISRYSYLCMNIIAIPILLCMDELLKLWLENPPEYTGIFVVFMLISGMISNLCAGFDASIQATGKVKKNQIGFCIINLSLLPLMFILYKLGVPPYINVILMAILSIASLIFQCYIMVGLTSFKVSDYMKQTIIPSFKSTLFAVTPLYLIHLFTPKVPFATLLFVVIGAIWTIMTIYLCGLTDNEKSIIAKYIKSKI